MVTWRDGASGGYRRIACVRFRGLEPLNLATFQQRAKGTMYILYTEKERKRERERERKKQNIHRFHLACM